MIQNAQSQLAQACCALRSERKWALTGTPIQNKLTDFASIVRFLGVYPYSQQRVFDDEISRPWYRGDPQGFLRLKALVRAIAISRSKSVVHLPHRVDEIHHLDFTAAEREVYDTAKRHTVTLLDDAISTRSQGGAAFNALQRLNILRLICCHGLLTRSNQATRAIQSRENFAETFCHSKSQILLCEELLGGPAACSQCGVDLLEEFLEGSPPSVLDTPQRTTRCGDMLCQQCTNQVKCFELDQASWYHQNPITDDINMSPDPSLDEDIEMVSIDSMSTKIKALVADILNHHLVEKRFDSLYFLAHR
jgi:SWI/SNF-related matrix-associated actin-dependent regulator of chromatin subfamily A3